MKENLTGKTELLEPAKITELILSENLTVLKALAAKGWDVNESYLYKTACKRLCRSRFITIKKTRFIFFWTKA